MLDERQKTINALYNSVPTESRSKHDKTKKLILKGLALILCVSIISTGSVAGYLAFTDSGFLSGSTKISDKINLSDKQVENVTTDSNSKGATLTTPQIVQKVLPSVVTIINTTSYAKGTGSGIIMTEDGYIITNAHVVSDAVSVTVVLGDGTEYAATIKGQDEKTDLAVLKIDAKNLSPAEFGNSDALVQGETAIAMGNPLDLAFAGSTTQGIISALGRKVTVDGKEMTYIQTDASINPGNSGGPLVNSYGQVIGINSAKISAYDTEGLGFAIPINDALPIVEELVDNGYVTGRPLIGISGEDVTAQISKYYGLPEGVYVRFVDPQSGAAAANIKAGDIIVKINGTVVTTMTALNSERDKYKAGEYVTLTVYRDDKTIDLKVKLSQAE